MYDHKEKTFHFIFYKKIKQYTKTSQRETTYVSDLSN